MNALVGIRANATGLYRPTPAARKTVAQSLAETARLSQLAALKPAATLKATGPSAAQRVLGQELSRDAFLRLLVLQLQNQDPLTPQGNEAMLAQLAQFTALEQMNNLNESFERLSGNIDQLNFISATQLLGRTVTGLANDGTPRTGVVEGVHLDGSVVILTVDGEPLSMAGVIRID